MADTLLPLTPTIDPASAAATSYQNTSAASSGPAENAFEDVLQEGNSTVGALSFLAEGGVSMAQVTNPTLGGAVIQSALSNTASMFGSGGYGGSGSLPGTFGLSGGVPLNSFNQYSGSTGGFGNTGFNSGFNGGVTAPGVASADGLNVNQVQSDIRQDGITQILLMAGVQQEVRRNETYSNILKAIHDMLMGAIRNIRQ